MTLRLHIPILVALMLSTSAVAASRPKLSPASSWPPAVRQAYDAVVATSKQTPIKNPEVAKAIANLGRTGQAHDALATLAFSTLPEPHRALGAIFFAQLYRFDPAALLNFVEDDNPFLARQAVDELADIGGKAISAKLSALAVKHPPLGNYIKKAIARMSDSGKPPFVLSQLNALLRGKTKKHKSMAGAVLSDTKDEAAEWGLALLLSPKVANVSDLDTQIFGALALVRRHDKDVPGLVRMAAPSNNKFVRLQSLRELAKTPAGKKALRELKLQPGDPMAKERDQLVR
jgi:hypothetical protein